MGRRRQLPPIPIRKAMLAYYRQGYGYTKVAVKFDVSPNEVRRALMLEDDFVPHASHRLPNPSRHYSPFGPTFDAAEAHEAWAVLCGHLMQEWRRVPAVSDEDVARGISLAAAHLRQRVRECGRLDVEPQTIAAFHEAGLTLDDLAAAGVHPVIAARAVLASCKGAC